MKFLAFIAHPGFDKLIRMSILALCLLALAGMGIYALHSGKNLDGISMILTALISVTLQIVGFDWGSSSGSKAKDDILGRMMLRADNKLVNPVTPSAP